MTVQLTAAATSALIAEIYDCALDPGRWPAMLARLHQSLGFANAILGVNDSRTGAATLEAMAGVPAPYSSTVHHYGADVLEQWGGWEGISSLPMAEPAVLSRVNTSPALYESRYYKEWGEPQGLTDVLAIGLVRDETTVGSLAFGKRGDGGLVTDEEVASAALFLPHLQRAVAISRIFEVRKVEASVFRVVLDQLRTPAFIVDGAMKLLFANAAGDRALHDGGALRVRDLVLSGGDRDALVRDAVGRAASGARGADGATGLPLWDSNGHLCALHVLPLRCGLERFSRESGAASLFLTSPETNGDGVAQLVSAAFGLTAAEGRVFAQVAGGGTIKKAAEELGMQQSTARTHLLRVFNKTGTHRQAELVRLAGSLSNPRQG